MILHRRRFLSKFGLHDLNAVGGGNGENALQANAIGLLHAVQYLKVPVIAANAITMIFELIFGS
jgi:immediate early response 3-interacting protein 1